MTPSSKKQKALEIPPCRRLRWEVAWNFQVQHEVEGGHCTRLRNSTTLGFWPFHPRPVALRPYPSREPDLVPSHHFLAILALLQQKIAHSPCQTFSHGSDVQVDVRRDLPIEPHWYRPRQVAVPKKNNCFPSSTTIQQSIVSIWEVSLVVPPPTTYAINTSILEKHNVAHLTLFKASARALFWHSDKKTSQQTKMRVRFARSHISTKIC